MAHPRKIADVLSQLIARRGYAREQSTAALDAAWREAVGQRFASTTRAGSLRRGTLEVFVANNLLAQELGFLKDELVVRLQQLAPDGQVNNLRFRIGSIA